MSNGVDLTIDELAKLANKTRRQHKYLGKSRTTGERRSTIHGNGLDLDQIRAYQSGDDVRSIDWKSTARLHQTHIRTYHEQRQRPILLVVDFTKSMRFGSRQTFKSIAAAHIATQIASIASSLQDRVGGVVFSEYGFKKVKPTTGTGGLQRLIQTLVDLHQSALAQEKAPDASITLKNLWPHFYRHQLPNALIFILSDFLDFSKQTKAQLTHASRRSQIILAHTKDPLEQTAPTPNHYWIQLGTTQTLLNTRSVKNCNLYEKFFADKTQELRNFARNIKQEYLIINCENNYLEKPSPPKSVQRIFG